MGSGGIFVGELCINCIVEKKKNHVCIYRNTCNTCLQMCISTNTKKGQVLCFIKRTYNLPQCYISE